MDVMQMESGFYAKGRVVFVQPATTKNGKPVMKVQLLTNGGKQRAAVLNITDMSNAQWNYGADYLVPLKVDSYIPKGGGVVLTYTAWEGGICLQGQQHTQPGKVQAM